MKICKLAAKMLTTKYTFKQQDVPNQQKCLPFIKGESLVFIENADKNWVLAINIKGMVGIVPKSYVDIGSKDFPDTVVLEWVDRALQYLTTGSDNTQCEPTHASKIKKVREFRASIVGKYLQQSPPVDTPPIPPRQVPAEMGEPAAAAATAVVGSRGKLRRAPAPPAPSKPPVVKQTGGEYDPLSTNATVTRDGGGGSEITDTGVNKCSLQQSNKPVGDCVRVLSQTYGQGDDGGSLMADWAVVDASGDDVNVAATSSSGSMSEARKRVFMSDVFRQLDDVGRCGGGRETGRAAGREMVNAVLRSLSQLDVMSPGSRRVCEELVRHNTEQLEREGEVGGGESRVPVTSCHSSLPPPAAAAEGNNSDPSIVTGDSELHDSLDTILAQLATCKDDSEQRNWPLYEDHAMIVECITSLTQIISEESNRDRVILYFLTNSDDHLDMLVKYFQMERRYSILVHMYHLFTSLCHLHISITNVLANTVLIQLLANYISDTITDSITTDSSTLSLQHYGNITAALRDTERSEHLLLSVKLLTLLLSTPNKLPLDHYYHLNVTFFTHLLTLIESDEVSAGVSDELSDALIHLILAFNLQHSDEAALAASSASPGTRSIILTCLAGTRLSAKVLTNRLIQILNRGVDPISSLVTPAVGDTHPRVSDTHPRVSDPHPRVNNTHSRIGDSQNQRHSVIKLIEDMFNDDATSLSASQHSPDASQHSQDASQHSQDASQHSQDASQHLTSASQHFTSASQHFYTNDILVLIDVILRVITDLPHGQHPLRQQHLSLLHSMLRSAATQYSEHRHRRHELQTVLNAITTHEEPLDGSTLHDMETYIARSILDDFKQYFSDSGSTAT